MVLTLGYEVDDAFTIIYGLVNEASSEFIVALDSELPLLHR